MNRRPVITGLTIGAGATTLAAALHATDGGRVDGPDQYAGRGADIVVCDATEAGLRHAAELVLPGPGPRPVLAVTGETPAEWVHLLERRFTAVVVLPHVGRWRAGADSTLEAPLVLAHPPDHLPRSLQPYASALLQVVEAVCGCGSLDRPAPPAAALPAIAALPAVAARPAG